MMSVNESQQDRSASQMIDERIGQLDDWRGKMLAQLRPLISMRPV